jgi:hypothetical protein
MWVHVYLFLEELPNLPSSGDEKQQAYQLVIAYSRMQSSKQLEI